MWLCPKIPPRPVSSNPLPSWYPESWQVRMTRQRPVVRVVRDLRVQHPDAGQVELRSGDLRAELDDTGVLGQRRVVADEAPAVDGARLDDEPDALRRHPPPGRLPASGRRRAVGGGPGRQVLELVLVADPAHRRRHDTADELHGSVDRERDRERGDRAGAGIRHVFEPEPEVQALNDQRDDAGRADREADGRDRDREVDDERDAAVEVGAAPLLPGLVSDTDLRVETQRRRQHGAQERVLADLDVEDDVVRLKARVEQEAPLVVGGDRERCTRVLNLDERSEKDRRSAHVCRPLERDGRLERVRGVAADEADEAVVGPEHRLDRLPVRGGDRDLPLAVADRELRFGELRQAREETAVPARRVLARNECQRPVDLHVRRGRRVRRRLRLPVEPHGQHPRQELQQVRLGVVRVGRVVFGRRCERPAVEHVEAERVDVVAVRIEPVLGPEPWPRKSASCSR